jgi:hypothetical protein
MLRERIETDGRSHPFFDGGSFNPESAALSAMHRDVNLEIQNRCRHFETSHGTPGTTN